MSDIPPPSIPMDDEPPIRDADDAPLRCKEPGCSNPVTKPARGRTPKFCDEHKGSKTSTSARKASWPMAGQVEDTLTMYLNGIGTGVMFIDQFDGRCIAKGSRPVAHEVVELIRPNKEWRHRAELLCSPGKYGPLMLALAPVILPILAHHNLIPQFIIPMVVTDADLVTTPDTAKGGMAA